MACTGLRVSEALRLQPSDIDWAADRIYVAHGKFHKARWVPIHPSATQALAAYQAHRDRALPAPTDAVFFLTERGTSLKWHRTYMTFRTIREQLGWTARPVWPRIHDLRHTFAVRTLLRWYEAGDPIGQKITALSTYLGHVKVSDTYWYFSAVPELLRAAAGRFEAYPGPARGPEGGRPHGRHE